MNQFITKISLATVATTVSVLGFSSAVWAGEGGVAGAAAFTVSNDNVTGVAVAAAVGKQDAAAAAYNAPSGNTGAIQNYAYSLGSAGVITIGAMGDVTTASIEGSADGSLGNEQGNSFSETIRGSIRLGTADEDVIVDFDP